jgi:uncharacterized protein
MRTWDQIVARAVLSPLAILVLVSFSRAWSAQEAGGQSPAAEQASAAALLQRAVTLYDNKDWRAALAAFRVAADEGSVEAMSYLGMMYAGGQGTIRSFPQALAWFGRASAAGDSQAMCNIGIFYYQGAGVQRNFRTAAGWFRRGAVAGNSQAMFNLGAMLRDGEGSPKDYEEA